MADDFSSIGSVIVNDVVKQLSAQSSTELSNWVKKSFSNSLKSSEFRNRLDNMHKELADIARKEMIRSYKAGKKRGREPYRQGDTGALKRYSNGQMDKGLNSGGLITANASGISFNFSVLDKYAKQWARLNFGASPRGSKPVKEEKIKVFRRNFSDSPTLSKFGARPGFAVPSKFGSLAVGSSKAYPVTPSVRSIVQSPRGSYIYVYRGKGLSNRGFRKASAGILGWRFLDKGIAKMNVEYGRKLTAVINGYINDGGKKSQGTKTKTVIVKPSGAVLFNRSTRAQAQNRDAFGRFIPGFKGYPKF